MLIMIEVEFVLTFFHLGSVLKKLGKLEEAISDYTRAIQIDPTFADAYLNRGRNIMFIRQEQH